MEHPSWSSGLERVGVYYQGVVDKLEDVLDGHRVQTVTCYVTRTSRNNGGQATKEKKV